MAENSYYYFFLRTWDSSVFPTVDYGDYTITNFSMNYSNYQQEVCFDCGAANDGEVFVNGTCESTR